MHMGNEVANAIRISNLIVVPGEKEEQLNWPIVAHKNNFDACTLADCGGPNYLPRDKLAKGW